MPWSEMSLMDTSLEAPDRELAQVGVLAPPASLQNALSVEPPSTTASRSASRVFRRANSAIAVGRRR